MPATAPTDRSAAVTGPWRGSPARARRRRRSSWPERATGRSVAGRRRPVDVIGLDAPRPPPVLDDGRIAWRRVLVLPADRPRQRAAAGSRRRSSSAGWRFEFEVEDAGLATSASGPRPVARRTRTTDRPRFVPSSRAGRVRRRRGRATPCRGRPAARSSVEAMKMENELRAPRDWDRRAGRRRPAARPSSSATSLVVIRMTRPTATEPPGRRPPARPIRPATAGARPLRAKAPARARPSDATRSRPRRASSSATCTRRPTRAGLDEDRDLGRPGEYPFTRGVQPTMYRSRFWTMRQYAGFATAEETNRRFRYLLEQGQTGLSVAFDLPTQMGYDSDAPRGARARSAGSASRSSSLADMAVLLDGLPLGEVTHVDDDQRDRADPARPVRRGGRGAGRRRGRRISGTTQNDILKEYIARGTYIFPPRPSMRLVTDVFEFCAARAARSGTRSRSRATTCARPGRPPPRSWPSRLADAIAYVEAAVARGPRRRRLRRPAVVLLRRLVGAVRGGRQVPGRPPDVGDDHARAVRGDRTRVRWSAGSTSRPPGSSLTAQSIDNNVVRTTVQALAAVLGGAQSLHTNSRDEALALPTEEAARLALRTQQILAYEAGRDRDARPAGRLLLRREPDQRARGRRLGLPRRDRVDGRDARRDRGRLPAAPDPGGRLPRPAGDRVGRPGRRRGQPLPRRRGPHAAAPADRPRRRAPPDRAGPAGPGRSARPRPGPRPWTASRRPPAATATSCPPILEAVRAYATVGEISDRLRVAWGEHRELITV